VVNVIVPKFLTLATFAYAVTKRLCSKNDCAKMLYILCRDLNEKKNLQLIVYIVRSTQYQNMKGIEKDFTTFFPTSNLSLKNDIIELFPYLETEELKF
jgi:hypothetical protein